MLRRSARLALTALLVASFVAPALGRQSAPAAFSGNVCALLGPSQIPHGVSTVCHQTKPDGSSAGKTTYTAKWGTSGLHLQIEISTFTGASARSADLANFKQETSILPQIGIPVATVKVGTWAREYATTKAVSVLFVAGGDDCVVFILNNVAKAADNAGYRAPALAIAQAIAAKLS